MMLTLMLLLVLSSVSLQKNLNSQDGNVSSLSPDLEHKVPEIPANISVFTSRRFLEGSKVSRHIRDAQGNVQQGKLKWQGMQTDWTVPNGAFSIYNNYVDRTDFVCKFLCHGGYVTPSNGNLCQVSEDNKVGWYNYFEVLLNEDDFENLEWKDGSRGSVPPNAVRLCADEELYVGKNEFGLGKVDPKQQSFILPWKGSEYRYRNYQVLTMSTDVENNFMTDLNYNMNEIRLISSPPESMHTSVVTNYDCKEATKTVTLTKTIKQEKRWDVSSSLTLGVTTEFSVGIPSIVEGKVQVSASTTFQASGGQTRTEEIAHSVSVSHPVLPNHSCTVRMMGHKYTTDIPFTARFGRKYRNGRTAWTYISSKYNSVEIGSIHAVIDPCTPVPNATPCP